VAHRHIKRALALTVGWVVIGLGVVGLFLPVLQGVLLILLGLYILSRESRVAREILHRLRDRYPEAYEAMQRAKARVVTVWHRRRGRAPVPDAERSRRDDREERGAGDRPSAPPPP